MRTDVLGLPLDEALEILASECAAPEVILTSAPKRREAEGGTLRVVAAADDAGRLTVARFFDPISDGGQN